MVEGEKCAQAVMNADLFANAGYSIAVTTSFDGAWKPGQKPKWLDSYNAYFAGKLVIVFEDNDESGRTYAATAAAAISNFASEVRRVSFPELPEKGDVSDFLETHSAAALEQRILSAPVWTKEVQNLSSKAVSTQARPATNFRFEDLNELLQRPEVPVNYLVEGLLVCGTVSCLVASRKSARVHWRGGSRSQLQLVRISWDEQLIKAMCSIWRWKSGWRTS